MAVGNRGHAALGARPNRPFDLVRYPAPQIDERSRRRSTAIARISTSGCPPGTTRNHADLDDLTRVREITQAYRHRVLLRCDPQAMAALMRTSEDVTSELGRKMAQGNTR